MSSATRSGSQLPDPGQGTLPLSAPPAPARPPLPKPERLNRNALTVAAVVMGTLVLAAVVFVQPTHSSGDAHARAGQTAQPAQGTFLDQAPQLRAVPMIEGHSLAPLGDTALRAPNAGNAPAPGVPSIASNPYAGGYGPSSGEGAPVAISPRIEAYRAALAAPVISSVSRSITIANDRNLEGDGSSSAYGDIAQQNAAHAAPAVSVGNAAVLGPGSEGARQQGREQTAGTSLVGVPAAFRTSVQAAPGPYAVQAGTVIPAVLITEINSDLPGQVLAQVSRDVYDSRSLTTLLVPKGSKLLGKYADQVGVGQNRLLVAWSRVILPDGRSIVLPGLETKDRTGAGGLHDQVDRHGGQVFGTAALLSLIGAGTQLSQPNGGYGALGSYPTAGQVAAGAVGQQLADVATQMLRRDLNVQPTIRIRQGMPFNVFIATDLVFSEPYVPAP
jgi:type IV secretory pathway VirB10-like protein